MPDAELAPMRDFYTVLAAAGSGYTASGWKVGTRGLTYRGADGHWGRVYLQATMSTPDVVRVQAFAGSLSPYLMSTVNDLSPGRLPPVTFVIVHAPSLWQINLQYTPIERPAPSPFDRSVRLGWSFPAYELDPQSLGPWLDDFLSVVVPEAEQMCSDIQMRDWFLDSNLAAAQGRRLSWPETRDAALLTRHLGLDQELPAILDRAREERDRADRDNAALGNRLVNTDRRRRYHATWSHARFLKFLEEAPR